VVHVVPKMMEVHHYHELVVLFRLGTSLPELAQYGTCRFTYMGDVESCTVGSVIATYSTLCRRMKKPKGTSAEYLDLRYTRLGRCVRG
jgi:hypothetical protein